MKPADICRNVDERVQKEAEILAKQGIAMGRKLEHERKRMKDEPLTLEYDNGGGQTGVRENPYYSAYNKLLSSYTKTLTTLITLIGDKDQEATGVLIDLRERFKVSS